MRACHGSGDLPDDGCCYVAGQVCPLRWKLEGGRVFDHQGTDLGTVTQFVNGYVTGKPRRDELVNQLTNITYVCRAAADVLVNDTKLINNRPAFEQAWNAHADYVAQVRPHWAQIETDLGLSAGSYQCSTWQGTGRDQCCFAEPDATNAAKRQNLAQTAVTIRQAGGKA